MRQFEHAPPPSDGEAALRAPLVTGERWMLERWPRFGFYFGMVLIGWLVLDILPWWTAPLVVIVDAGWSARRGDWSLVAFLVWSAIAAAAAVAVVSLLL